MVRRRRRNKEGEVRRWRNVPEIVLGLEEKMSLYQEKRAVIWPERLDAG